MKDSKTVEHKRKIGDTLDYYNDSMPRKAVENLLDKADKKDTAPNSVIADDYDNLEDIVSTPPISSKTGDKSKSYDSSDIDLSIYSRTHKKERTKVDLSDEAAQRELLKSPDEDYEDYENERNNFFKIALAGVGFVFLIILAFLVVKINSTTALYKEATAKIEEYEKEKDAQSKTKIENEKLQEDVELLNAEIEKLKAQVSQNANPENPANPSTTAPTTKTPTSSENNNNSSYSTYTVVAGDSLSKISTKVYGTMKHYQKIMEANNMKDERISIGQVLKIPKL